MAKVQSAVDVAMMAVMQLNPTEVMGPSSEVMDPNLTGPKAIGRRISTTAHRRGHLD